MRNKIFILSFAMFLSFFAFSAHAQVASSDISIDISPEFPKPNETVKVTLSSFSIDLNKSNIAWSVNSKEVITSVGKKDFTFEMGGFGENTYIEAKIYTTGGQSLIKNISVSSANIDMLWEAYDSYVPPFYRGKTLASQEINYKIVAIPNMMSGGYRANADQMSYTWTKDDDGQVESSGFGKSSFIFKNTYLESSNTIEVVASDITGKNSTSGSITVTGSDPKIVFYRNDPVFGVDIDHALKDNFNLNNKGDSIFVAPYFFSPKMINSQELVFDWSLNGEVIATPNPKNILSIKPNNSQSGVAVIKIAVNNARSLFQTLEKTINANF
ncbi:MAG: hypothetical protein NTZ44_01205 [Candidatus Nomurabacteria bacterium]|nr:hypothetical protein [Candidatus Nomurabacteria bacterium]